MVLVNSPSSLSGFHGSLLYAMLSTIFGLSASDPRASHSFDLDLYFLAIAKAASLSLGLIAELGEQRNENPHSPLNIVEKS